jgi:hypothetical protein
MSRNATARPFGMPSANLAVAPAASEETLVADARSGVTPAQMVELRLVFLLQGTPLPRGSGETFEPRRALSYAGAGDQTQAGRQQIKDRGVYLGTPSALA